MKWLSKKEIDSIKEFVPECHEEMMLFLSENLPALFKHTSNYGKKQSQFMDNMLTCSHPTPIRNLRQICAEVGNSIRALKETYFKQENVKLDLEEKRQKYVSQEMYSNSFEARRLGIEISKLESDLDDSKLYISGAIRRITNYALQFQSILKSIGVSSIDEVDFEKEEEKYHIMTAFSQGLISARAHNGIIDEGNQIYFFQIGINGTVAQREVSSFLNKEQQAFREGSEPSHEMILTFLNDMSKKFEGCSTKYALLKGQTGQISEIASIQGVKND